MVDAYRHLKTGQKSAIRVIILSLIPLAINVAKLAQGFCHLRQLPKEKSLACAPVRVGIGGWDYDPWRGAFYPPKLPKARQLEYAAQHLRAIEINATFSSAAISRGTPPPRWR